MAYQQWNHLATDECCNRGSTFWMNWFLDFTERSDFHSYIAIFFVVHSAHGIVDWVALPPPPLKSVVSLVFFSWGLEKRRRTSTVAWINSRMKVRRRWVKEPDRSENASASMGLVSPLHHASLTKPNHGAEYRELEGVMDTLKSTINSTFADACYGGGGPSCF